MISPQPPATQNAAGHVLVDTDFSGVTLPKAEAANFFHFSQSGHEVQLLVGFLDLQRVYQASLLPGDTTLVPEVTHRLFLSIRGLLILKHQVDEMAMNMRTSGVPVDQIMKNITGADR